MPLPNKVASTDDLVKLLKDLDERFVKAACIQLAKGRKRKHDQTLRDVGDLGGNMMVQELQKKSQKDVAKEVVDEIFHELEGRRNLFLLERCEKKIQQEIRHTCEEIVREKLDDTH